MVDGGSFVTLPQVPQMKDYVISSLTLLNIKFRVNNFTLKWPEMSEKECRDRNAV